MNLIKNIRLKFSNFFTKKEPPQKRNIMAEAASVTEELDMLRYLSGISALRKGSAVETAYERLLAEETEVHYQKLRDDPKELIDIQLKAANEAAGRLMRDENALAMANAMEGRNRKIQDEKHAFDESWSKYAKRHIRKRDPKAVDFAKFLIKHDYIEEEVLDEIAVTAIFYDNEISNFNEFRIELKRVNDLELVV